MASMGFGQNPKAPEGGTALAERTADAVSTAPVWMTIVWDDPVNLMSYVTYVFSTYFQYPKEKSHRLMMQVHTEGRAVVSTGDLEQMERDVNAMHGFGLWATLEKAE